MLTIYEELFLLALDEENGNFLPFTRKTVPFGLAGGMLAELALLGKVCSNEKQRLIINDAASTRNELLDEVIQEIQASEKHRKISYWISHFSEKPKKLRSKIGEGLAAQDLLEQDENRFYWRTQPSDGIDPGVPSKFQRKLPLRSLVFDSSTGDSADPHSLALLNVAAACDLLSLIFTQDELPAAKAGIHEKVIQAALRNPSLETIEKIEVAIAASIEDDSD